MTLSGPLWEAINFDIGLIALGNEYSLSKDLPLAQPFSWDESKSIYTLNSFHNLHCLVRFRYPTRSHERWD